MKKYQTATQILLPRDNKAMCPIFEHEGKFYIKANKPNTSSYTPCYLNNEEYAEVEKIGNNWFTV